METVVGGRLVHYEDLNYTLKPVMVILHGWGHEASWWVPFSKRFSDYRVVIPDLPAFGHSQPLMGSLSIPQYGDWVSGFLKKLKIHSPILVGHSTGGQIAAYAVAKKLIKPECLVLAAPALERYEEKVLPLSIKLARSLSLFKPYLPKIVVNTLSTTTDHGVASEEQKKILRRFIRFNTTPLLHSITVPTLSVWGERDKETLGQPMKLAHMVPKGRLKIIYRAGHNLYVEEPEKLFRHIQHFLQMYESI